MAAAIMLILQGLAVLIEWLAYRKDKGIRLSDRQRRQLGHVAARMQTFLQLSGEFGVMPQPDSESMIETD